MSHVTLLVPIAARGDEEYIRLRYDKSQVDYHIEDIPWGIKYFVKYIGLTQLKLWDGYSKCDNDTMIFKGES